MKPEEMKKRYIYEVVRRLPKEKRLDIENELSALIDDEINHHTDKNIEEILLEFGNPSVLASQYLDKKRVLIGPRYYDQYIQLIQLIIPIVMGSVLLGMIVSKLMGTNPFSIEWLIEIVAAMYNGALSAFAFITIGFIIAEHTQKETAESNWHPKELKNVEIVDLRIKKAEPIFGMIFIGILIILLNFTPELFSIYSFGDELVQITIFNLDVLKQWIIPINLILILGLVGEWTKLFYRQWNKKLFFIHFGISFISMILFLIIVNQPQFINPNLQTELEAIGWSSSVVWLNQFVLSISVLTVFGFTIGAVVQAIKIWKK